MRVEVRFEIDDATLAALWMFAEYLDMSVEEYIEDYLEWEFSASGRAVAAKFGCKTLRKRRKKRLARGSQALNFFWW